MSDDYKIGKVAEMTGLSVRKIKFYTGTSSKKNRDPKFFTPSGRTLRDDGQVKNWYFSKDDVRKIEYIHMLELLDYEVEYIRQIMQSEDYIGNTDFKDLLKRIDNKIDLYQGFKMYVMNLASLGPALWNANDFSAGRMADYFRLSTKRYGKIFDAYQRAMGPQSNEFYAATQSIFSEFSRIRYMPIDSDEAISAANDLAEFTETYFGSSTPLMMLLSYCLISENIGQAEILDKEFGEGTVQYIADVVSKRYEEEMQRLLQRIDEKKEYGIESDEVKAAVSELLMHRFCIEKGKLDITFFLAAIFEGDSDNDDSDEYAFAVQAIERHYEEPIKKVMIDLAKLRETPDQREIIEKNAIILLGKIMELFNESLPDSIEWISFIISEMKSIQGGIDRMAGVGAAAFVATELKNRYDKLVRSALENIEL